LFRAFTYDSILQKKDTVVDVTPDQIETSFDSTLNFFTDHPKLKKYQPDVENYTANINSIMYGMTTTGK
jgi:hypothetical protein